ncbi:MAG TPA: isochorismatase family cysteine hydrolase, partial [Ottowia sp.]|nr:isochorismatase family cysteine hydrolase [Ottowia sp.]
MKINAQPFAYEFDPAHTALVLIDMQRDFIEPGGFGETLGNNVSLLEAIVPATQAVLSAWRAAGGLVVHTREAHRPDLSDCPPAKRNRGNPRLRIGDAGPMGRILIAGEPGNQIVAELAPVAGEVVIDKPGKGMFWATGLHETLQEKGITQL